MWWIVFEYYIFNENAKLNLNDNCTMTPNAPFMAIVQLKYLQVDSPHTRTHTKRPISWNIENITIPQL